MNDRVAVPRWIWLWRRHHGDVSKIRRATLLRSKAQNFFRIFFFSPQKCTASTIRHHNREIKITKRPCTSSARGTTEDGGRGTVTSGTLLRKHLHTTAAAQRLSHLPKPPTKNIWTDGRLQYRTLLTTSLHAGLDKCCVFLSF